ncbi:H-NS histone family protein [Paraburkholderia guartelaensis]|uniref:H-NS histone family protein n=1 Tax=Paraburkholderia guartelaensis TaxID=2546446 RepID=A0A4R5L0Q7_9BURK|nr:H-NS histone family protein [Paraburkholderia guartelaensis]TDG02016.1 H-NS histone family protein [Paraburkholderia guartelaensis]
MTKAYKELLAEKRELDARIAAARGAEREHALRKIRELMAQFDIGADELVVKRGSRSTGAQPAKYRDPVSGATWSGRGREPRWLAGKDRAAFAL